MALLREHMAQGLADAISDRVQLGAKPVVIQAPPSAVAEYPLVAVWIEKTIESYTMAGAVLQDANGALVAGASATTEGGDLVDGDPIVLSDGVTATSIGTLRCSGRIWAGSRYPGKREEIEQAVMLAFNQDDAARGRLMIPLTNYQLGQYTVRFGFAAADITESSWVPEHAFEARLWSWRPFTMDAPLLVPRTDPLAKQLVLAISSDLAAQVAQPADLNTMTDLQELLVQSDGSFADTTI